MRMTGIGGEEHGSGVSDVLLFLRGWLQAPRRVGAVAPSSRQLCMAMAAQIDPAIPGIVFELGPGTGQLTRQLIERGIAPERIVAIEANLEFVEYLRGLFPEVNIIHGDACRLEEYWRELGEPEVAAVASGLPLLSIGREAVDSVLGQVKKILKPGRPLLQFTYGLWSPVDREAYEFTGGPAARVLRNVPPASVWRYEVPGTETRAV